ncbi:MAG: hypothetical protein ACHRXM_15090 [Isosphaerales bacterium]
MLEIEKAEAETPLCSDPNRWADILNSIENFIDFECEDRSKGYLELKKFAERQLACLDSLSQTPPATFTDESMPEIREIPNVLDTDRPIRSNCLDELLRTVVDDPSTWLATPSEQLGWRKPGDLIGTDEEAKVVSLLQAVDQGLF